METITPTLFASYLKREIAITELLLNDPKLALLRASAPKHPAISRYDTITRYLEGALPFKYPDESDLVFTIGSALLDAMVLGNKETAEATIKTITDPEVIRQLRRRASDPQQFFDQMTAFRCWSLLRQANYEPHLVEQEGMPDIALPIRGGEQWIECKRLRLGTGVSRVRRVIKDANAQIKRADANGAGAVYIFVERPQYRIVFDDAVPHEVGAVVNEVERELASGSSRSVATVIVGWDDYSMLGDFPSPTSYFFRRRSLVRTHRSPRRVLAFPPNALTLDRTTGLQLKWDGQLASQTPVEKLRVGDFVASEWFRQECEVPGYVRAIHATAVLEAPDKILKYRVGEADIILATKRNSFGARPYTIIVLASIMKSSKQILLAFRYYRDEEPAWEESAYDIFMSFLERYGLPVTVGSQTGLLIPTAVVPRVGQATLVAAHADQCDEPLLASIIIARDGTPPTAEISWAFAISKRRYRADFMKHRR